MTATRRYRVTFEVESDNAWISDNDGTKESIRYGRGATASWYSVPAGATIEELEPSPADGFYRDNEGSDSFCIYRRWDGKWRKLDGAGEWNEIAGYDAIYMDHKDWPINDDAVRGGALVRIEN